MAGKRKNVKQCASDGNAAKSARVVHVTVRVQPGGKRNNLLRTADGGLKIAVTAPAVEGKANAALIGFLSDVLGIPKRAITVVHGDKARTKTVRIEGFTQEEWDKRIAEWATHEE
jgi:hypothetical protein